MPYSVFFIGSAAFCDCLRRLAASCGVLRFSSRPSFCGTRMHMWHYYYEHRIWLQECVSVTEACRWRAGPEGPAHRGWLGVVDTRSQPICCQPHRLNTDCLTCCYISRRATRQTGLGANVSVTDVSVTLYWKQTWIGNC